MITPSAPGDNSGYAFINGNTGLPPVMPLEETFIKHARHDSVGLGLAIFQHICDATGLSIDYVYENKRHSNLSRGIATTHPRFQ